MQFILHESAEQLVHRGIFEHHQGKARIIPNCLNRLTIRLLINICKCLHAEQ